MARRVIATAEVQVNSNTTAAEEGLNDLTTTFRKIGREAERGAQKAEVAMFSATQNMAGGYRKVLAASRDLIAEMKQGDRVAQLMAAELEKAFEKARKLGTADLRHAEALRIFKQIAGAVDELGDHLDQTVGHAARLKREAQEIEGEIRSAEIRAERLGAAFRDVGRDIDVAMAGGLEGVQDDIRQTIRRLEDMGGEFRNVGRIGQQALEDAERGMAEFDGQTDQATAALLRLERQLRDVASISDRALEGLDNDARKAAAGMDRLSRSAKKADRSLDGIRGSTRKLSGDVRGLIGLIGAAGLGYAITSVTRFGLDMTQQLEKSEAAFLGLTGSVEGAADMLERMVIFARETPYNLANVTQAAAQLLAVGDGFGVTADNVDEYLTKFGNALTITGGSEDQFVRIVRVLGQMSSTGKVLGQDMNQLAQNLPGFNVWQTLADGAGTSVQELRRLQDIGQLDELLTGDEAVQILIEGMEGIPGAAGAMERRMNTLGGAIEKFKETAQLAISDGLEPFSETAQEVLTDTVILNSVEDLSKAFGSLASSGLEAIAPELDDLAAAGEKFLEAMESWAPVMAHVVDALGDFLNFVSPIVSGLGKATDAVLGFGGGLGKLASAAALFAVGGPIGIGAGLLLGVSGAMDVFGGSAEDAADLARLLAAAQTDVNTAMNGGEEVILSESQQLALDTAEKLYEIYPALAGAMNEYGVTVADLADGVTGEMNPAMQAMLEANRDAVRDNFGLPDEGLADYWNTNEVLEQMSNYEDAVKLVTTASEEEAEKQSAAWGIAGLAERAELDRRQDAYEAQADAVAEYYTDMGDAQQEAFEAAGEVVEGWGELDEERTDKVKALLQEQADAYTEWADDIDGSTSSAALSLSSVAEEAENDVGKMIQAIEDHTLATAGWQNNIVSVGALLSTEFGASEEDAQAFMGTLGEMGDEAAPALQSMLDDFAAGGTQLKDFFDAVAADKEIMDRSLTGMFDEATGSVPDLAESLAEGTLTIEEVLTALPDAMEEAGLDLEAAAEAIDASDELGYVGEQAVQGLVDALNDGTSRVRTAAARLAAAAGAGARSPAGLDMESPSKVMMEIGELAGEGLIVGMQSMSDETYAAGVQAALILAAGIEDSFSDAEDPQEAAREFAEDVADSIVEELIAEQENVADAAEALAMAAADRLAEAWDRVKDRFQNRDIKEAITEAQAELSEAQAELEAARSLAGAGGARALKAAERRVAKANDALELAQAADGQADLLADQTVTAFQRGTEDAVAALEATQVAETEAIQARIDAATRNLDPVARAAAEAELAATLERHDAEMLALERRREDEETALSLRLDNENRIRDEAIKAQQDELKAFEKALDDVVKSIADAIEDLPDLRGDVSDASRDVKDAFFDQFEDMLENVDTADLDLLRSIGSQAGLSDTEINELLAAASASSAATTGAAAAALGVEQLIAMLMDGTINLGDLFDSALPSTLSGLFDSLTSGTTPSSQLVDTEGAAAAYSTGGYTGPLVTMPGAIIQDATDADLVAQRLIVALSAAGMG